MPAPRAGPGRPCLGSSPPGRWERGRLRPADVRRGGRIAGSLSLQLFSVRTDAERDLQGVLARVGAMGFVGVEPAGLHGHPPAEVRRWIEDAGLTLHSAHARLPVGADADAVLDEHEALGNPVLVVSADDFASREAIDRFADGLAEAADRAAERGMRVGYHNHAVEFSSRPDGRPAYDLLLERLDPRVLLEVDLYWATVGGVDPAALLPCLGQRVPFVHVKDGPVEPVEPMTPVGQGRVDIEGSLRASAAVAWHIIELDSSAGDMWEAIEASRSFLLEHGLSVGRAAG